MGVSSQCWGIPHHGEIHPEMVYDLDDNWVNPMTCRKPPHVHHLHSDKNRSLRPLSGKVNGMWNWRTGVETQGRNPWAFEILQSYLSPIVVPCFLLHPYGGFLKWGYPQIIILILIGIVPCKTPINS